MKLFDAILNTNTVKEAAEILGVHHTKVKSMLEAEGVKHEKGQRYKEAVKNFIEAGKPIQLSFNFSLQHSQTP